MAITPGTRLGPFEIISRLGAGGMGEVWRARDTRLQRDVAIKVLPAALTVDAERLARFDREARLLASMNHPRIGGLLGLEDAEGVPALVLELIEGPTLAEHIARRGALPPREALTLALQIAEAIEYAHERGIVHRDLKPANVKFTADDSLKVLDFGLAKALLGEDTTDLNTPLSHSPTMTLGTHVGTLLGTAAYMAPEQARGKPVDRRADIWAFGVVLFEMLAGRGLFAGETVSDTIARILEREPDWSLLPPNTPERVRELLKRCLEKDARQRLRDIGDARLELETALREIESGVIPPRSLAASRRVPWFAWPGMAVLVVAAFAAGARLSGRNAGAPDRVIRSTLVPPPELSVRAIMPSPDGLSVFARGRRRADDHERESEPQLYRRTLNDFAWRPLAGTEGTESYDLSLDGRWLYFAAPTVPGSVKLHLSRTAADGSAPPTTLMPWHSDWSSWEAIPGERFVVISAHSDSVAVIDPGRPEAATWRKLRKDMEIQDLSLTQTLPGGGACIGSAGYFSPSGWAVDAIVLDLKSAELRVLLPNSVAQGVLPGNVMLLTRGSTVLASAYNPSRLQLTGAPVTVLEGVRANNNWGHGQAGSSNRGDLIYPPGTVDPGRRRLAVLAPDGRWEDWNEEFGPFEKPPAVTPDGRLAVVTNVPPGTSSYELLVLTRGQIGSRRLVSEPNEDCGAPVISPDGRTVLFLRQGAPAAAGVYQIPLDGSTPARRLLAAKEDTRAYDLASGWMPDGRSILLQTFEGSRVRIRVLTPGAGAPQVRELNASKRSAWSPCVSPDGALLAFLSDETGDPGVRVAPLRPDGSLGSSVQVSRSEATSVAWWPVGNTLVYTTPDKTLMECRIGADLSVSPAVPRAALGDHINDPGDYTLLPDGSILVTHMAENEGDIRQFNMVVGFASEVERLMAGARK